MQRPRLSSAELVEESLLVSIFDGSLIDLKRSPFRFPSGFSVGGCAAVPLNSAPRLRKREFPPLDYIKQKYLTRRTNRGHWGEAQKTKVPINEKLNLPIPEALDRVAGTGPSALANPGAGPRKASGLKKSRIRLYNIDKNPFLPLKKSVTSPVAVANTLSLRSRGQKARVFFPGGLQSSSVDPRRRALHLEPPRKKKPKWELGSSGEIKGEIKSRGPSEAPLEMESRRFSEVLRAIRAMYQNRQSLSQSPSDKAQLEKALEALTLEPSDFKGFRNLLSKFLQGLPLCAADLRVSDLETVLFLLFLVKKKFRQLGSLAWSCESLTALRAGGVNKRSEQNYKIILKRFFKKVIGDFNRRRGLDAKDDFEFYKAHFAAASRRLGHDWRKLRFETVFNERRVCFSQEYRRQSKKIFARILKRSAAFMRLLNEYLADRLRLEGKTHGIVVDYLPTLRKKVLQLSRKWAGSFCARRGNLRARLARFVVDNLRNNKVKLPWSMVEIRQGIANVRRLFQRAE